MHTTIKVKVLDYYNKPTYYPFMDNQLFQILEQAFLDNLEYTNVPENLFNKMINGLNQSISLEINYSLN